MPALIDVDAQVGLLALDPVPNAERLVAALHRLIHRAQPAGASIVFLQNRDPAGSIDEPGTPGRQLDDRLRSEASDIVIEKTLGDEFHLAHADDLVFSIPTLQAATTADRTLRRQMTRGAGSRSRRSRTLVSTASRLTSVASFASTDAQFCLNSGTDAPVRRSHRTANLGVLRRSST